MTNVGVLPSVARGSLVAADDPFGLPGIGVDQQLEVSRWLMHVQTQGMKTLLAVIETSLQGIMHNCA